MSNTISSSNASSEAAVVTSISEAFNLAASEWKVNIGIKFKLLVFLFRLAGLAHHSSLFVKLVAWPVAAAYKIYSQCIIGLDLDPRTRIGIGLRIFHGYGVVIHRDAKIGRNCTLRQGVTIGNKGVSAAAGACPVIGDNVEFGAGAVVVGGIKIGNDVLVGANTVISRDIPDRVIASVAPPMIRIK